jgi:uncharacterized membrane protein YgcG
MPKAISILFAALTLLVCCSATGTAAAALVPPGNSAANQYTETFPTSKGEEDEEGKKKSGVKPAQVLGAGKAHQLEDKGRTGKAVADFAAETAPAAVDPAPEAEGGNGEAKPGKSGKDKAGKNGAGGASGGDEEGSAGTGGGGGSPSGGSGSASSSGSSSLGEIASQATGTSAGSVGLWLPLILIAVVIWSAAYVWRNRQQRVV